MGQGRNSTIHPLHVPVAGAHNRITEAVRRQSAGFRVTEGDDVDQTVRPTDGFFYVYDVASGLLKAALAPPFLKFNVNGTLSVVATDEDPMASAGKLIVVRARLKTAGTSTTTTILKHTTANGATTTSVATFSFTTGNHTPTSTPAVSKTFAIDDYWWLDTTAAGTGAGGLVVSGWATAA